MMRTRSYVGGAHRRRPRFCFGPGGAQSSSRDFMAGWATNRKSRPGAVVEAGSAKAGMVFDGLLA